MAELQVAKHPEAGPLIPILPLTAESAFHNMHLKSYTCGLVRHLPATKKGRKEGVGRKRTESLQGPLPMPQENSICRLEDIKSHVTDSRKKG